MNLGNINVFHITKLKILIQLQVKCLFNYNKLVISNYNTISCNNIINVTLIIEK